MWELTSPPKSDLQIFLQSNTSEGNTSPHSNRIQQGPWCENECSLACCVVTQIDPPVPYSRGLKTFSSKMSPAFGEKQEVQSLAKRAVE